MFATGHPAYFIGALKFVAGQKKIPVQADAFIESSMSFGPIQARGDGLRDRSDAGGSPAKRGEGEQFLGGGS